MTILPTLRTKYGAGIGVELFFAFPEIQDNEKTFLDADSNAGDVTFVANGVNFDIGQFIVVGQPGNEKTEILQIGSVSATAIGLASPAIFPHNRGDIVRFIPYNQIAPEYSTDGIAWNTITPVVIRSDATETYMQRPTDLSTYEYRFRFYNTVAIQYSGYSNTVLASGYADNTIWSVKHRALGQLGEVVGDLITDSFLDDSIQEARRSVDQWPSIFRWSFRTKFGVILAQMRAGTWQITAPADLRDRNTYKNILSLRYGSQNRPIIYQDRTRFNQNYLNIVHTAVTVVANSGDVTLTLKSTHDMDLAGAATLSSQAVGAGTVAIQYTGNNRATNTLTGVTGIPAS